MDSASLPDLIRAAKGGDPQAWSELVRRFQDLAVASALGWSGDLESARDIAQEAFALAFRHLGALEDARAFPGWFAQLVRTARGRYRRRERQMVSLGDGAGVGDHPDPAATVERRYEAERVRAAVEALPEPERMVIALHYLADLSYPEVAAFLGISVAAAKKRAHVARQRLKELISMTADTLASARPSRNDRFRETVLFFAAIRHRDAVAVQRLLERSTWLVSAEEDWSEAEAFAARMPFAAHATPLVRAAGVGDVEIARLLLAAGADPNRLCGCAGAETPLWTATLIGSSELVALLLGAGANPNEPAFAGATPLHVAEQRGRQDLAGLLLRAGADPNRADSRGRTPADWSELPTRPVGTVAQPERDVLPTGIRALDVFAPLGRGDLQRWPAGIGAGQLVTLMEIARALSFAETWWVGFEQDLVDADQVRHGQLELGVQGQVRLVPPTADIAAARAQFAATLRELAHGGDRPRLVVCLEAHGHAHDVTLALPFLAANANVVATLVIEPFTGDQPALGDRPPEGYSGQVAFDQRRAVRHLLPAVDPRVTVSRHYPSDRHAQLAQVARRLLESYQAQDPELALPDPITFVQPAEAAAAQRLLQFLKQPYVIAEAFSSEPGESTPYEELLCLVAEIVVEVEGA